MKTGTQLTHKASTSISAEKTPVPTPETSHDDAPDIETQLDAARLGHSFASVGVRATPQGAIQPKLTVGAPDDKYEDEADRVAGQVMRMPDSAVQRATPEDEEDNIRTKPDVQRKAEGSFDAGANVEARIAARHGSGSPLPEATRAFMEPRFGADFSGVRVHADAEAGQISQDLSARAFTTGSDIYFRQGEYSPSSTGGQELLAHELTHVVQQSGAMAQRSLPQRQRIQPASPSLQRKIGFEFETAIPMSRYVDGEDSPGTLSQQQKMDLRGQLAADAKENENLLMIGGASKRTRVISHEDVGSTNDYSITADNGQGRLQIALANTEYVTKATPIASLAAEKTKVQTTKQGVQAVLDAITNPRKRYKINSYAAGYPSDALITALYPQKADEVKQHFQEGMGRVNGNAMVQVNIGVELAQMEQLLLDPRGATGIQTLQSEPHLSTGKKGEPKATQQEEQMAMSVVADVHKAIGVVMDEKKVKAIFGKEAPDTPLKQAAPRLRGWLALFFNLLYRARFATPTGLLKDTTPILSKSGLGLLYRSIYEDAGANPKEAEAVSNAILNKTMILVANDNDDALVFARAAKYLRAEVDEAPLEFRHLESLTVFDALEEILVKGYDPITAGMLALKTDEHKRRTVKTSMKAPDTIPDTRQAQNQQKQVTRSVMELRHLGGLWPFGEDWQAKAEPYIQYAIRNEPGVQQALVQGATVTKDE